MKRSRRVALAALCVLALALGAATLNDTTTLRGGGAPGSAADSSEREWSFQFGSSNTSAPPGIDIGGTRLLCIEFLTTSTFYALAFIGLLVLGAVLYRKGGLLLAVTGIGVLATPGFVLWALLTRCSPREPPRTAGDVSSNASASGGLLGGPSSGVVPTAGTPDLSQTILAFAAIIVVFLALFMIRATAADEGDDHTPDADEEEVPPESLAGIAGVAGEAADRIEAAGTGTENEVYRAWREMTRFLDVPNPRTATPAEFREAAQSAGMADRHVSALTDLFRDVRYGGADATTDREQAAVDALRQIERAYGVEGDDES